MRLAEHTGETATLSVPSGGDAVTVDFVPGGASVVSMARLGRPSVLHATAVGKVALAFGADREAPAGQLTAYTERTITDHAALGAELDEIRARGFAEAIGEREADLAAVAAPVLGRGGELAAIVGVQGPVARLPAATRRALRTQVVEAAAELSALLGGRRS